MNRKALFTLLAFVAFTLGAIWFYMCRVKQICDRTEDNVIPTIKSNINQAIAFKWNEYDAMVGNTFSETREQLYREIPGASQLEIIGMYDVDEVNNTEYENLGMARAASIRALFPELLDQQLSLKSEVTDLDSTARFFKASHMNIVFGHLHEQDIDTTENLTDSFDYDY